MGLENREPTKWIYFRDMKYLYLTDIQTYVLNLFQINDASTFHEIKALMLFDMNINLAALRCAFITYVCSSKHLTSL